MTSRQFLLALVVLIGLGILFTAGKFLLERPVSTTPSPTGEVTACTMDAMICPDGSAVGRIPPNCQFAQCPVPSATTTASTGTFTAALGQKLTTTPSITPLEVLEDSRCPANANCIQAGTVRLRTDIGGTSYTLVWNQAITVGTRSIKLVGVQPMAVAGKEIADSAYRFMIELK